MREPIMDGRKATYRTVTLYIRDDETLEDYLDNARDAFFMEEEMEKLMSEPQVSIENLLEDLEKINTEEEQKKAKKTLRTLIPARNE